MMGAFKSIESVYPPPPPHMVGDGFRVHNFFPGGYHFGLKRMSPFFLLDYNAKIELPPSAEPKGVGVHPHRGFETVTIAYHGKVAHHDSNGNSGVIGEGDVQWMTAGSGVLHKEYHEKEFSRRGGAFQMVQLWVNLPAKDKMSPPNYQALVHAEMGRYALPGGAGEVFVIAGEYNGAKGPARTFTPVNLFDARLRRGGMMHLRFGEHSNTALLIVEGKVTLNGAAEAPADHFALFGNDGTEIDVEAAEESIVLALNGEPIAEPIASYGPFVMNTEQEIEQAIEDFNRGKFGYLED